MRILLTQARSAITLDLARQLNRAGHKVFVLDTLRQSVCRFSSCVAKWFVVSQPRKTPAAFLGDVRRIVAQERIERIIPIFEEIFYLASDASLRALVFAVPSAVLDVLHNKLSFAQAAKHIGLRVADTTFLGCADDVARLDRRFSYALKPCYARAAQALIKFTPTMAAPKLDHAHKAGFVAQRWIDGRRFCSYSVCEAGVVRAHVVYPVDYTVDGHSCVYFTAVAHAKIDAWVSKLACALQLRGQIAIDFIQADDGQLFAIECNPRATSGVHLFAGTTHLAIALTATTARPTHTMPKAALSASASLHVRPKQLGFGMMLYAWRQQGRAQKSIWAFLRDMLTTADVVFDARDVWPWLLQPLAFWALWRQSRRLGLSLPGAYLFDYEWEPRSRVLMHKPPTCTQQRRYA